jgi:hypothetical protein
MACSCMKRAIEYCVGYAERKFCDWFRKEQHTYHYVCVHEMYVDRYCKEPILKLTIAMT